jgi:peptide/nickel transport system ATP-binding protein
VLIAMAMMASPKLLVADEPTTALDVTIQAQILAMLRALAEESQVAALLITHDLAVAASMAKRVLVMNEGKIVETGATRTIVHAPAHAYTRELIASRFDLSSDRARPLAAKQHTRAPSWTELWPEHRPAMGDAVLSLSGVSKSYATVPAPSGAAGACSRRCAPSI